MKILPIALAAIFSLEAYSQTDAQVDSLSLAVCATFNASTATTHEDKIDEALLQNLEPFLLKFSVLLLDEDKSAEFNKRFEARMNKNCPSIFQHELSDTEKLNGAPEYIEKISTQNLNKKSCRNLLKNSDFYYFDGIENIDVSIKNNTYLEKFADGSYSKLAFEWTGDCTFDLIFIESNHPKRKYYSKKGEIYHYTIYDNYEGTYKIWSQASDGPIVSLKLNVKQ
ncbi:hypothetical protein AM493_07975 [Flavobacterium akiainvivens]|uniref:Uncharacterized protein n=1 Tax=Flavobacterium akiainvivens TaxID=1202724 RepID=A0A0N0RQP3_9FLAO|nr:hypothetical protein [Flavobacterium akiainvivens]KOS05980.1 hypothetical protein AM493_07975 [Flavobacterium akiainvivens]SFQ53869.1 hypothetical protein SAMN05444144_10776 [Flavobacterium akiainvivens]